MASSSNKEIGPLHFSLIFFVMLSLLMSILWWIQRKDYNDVAVKEAAAANRASTVSGALSAVQADVEQLKNQIGYNQEQLGATNPPADGSVRDAILKDLAVFAQDAPGPKPTTLAAALKSMRTSLENNQAEIKGLKESVKLESERLLALKGIYQNEVDKHKTAKDSSETRTQELIAEKETELTGKNRDIKKWEEDYRKEESEKSTLADQLARKTSEYEKLIENLKNTISYMRREKQRLEQTTFEVADGQITRVNGDLNSVWVNLGTANRIREGVTFSVFDHTATNVGKNPKDIKGRIQITKIIGSDISEGRILDQDDRRPIATKDPIFSPIWNAGRKQSFACAGIMDLDGDGISDRKAWHDLIEKAGGILQVEVLEDGTRVPESGAITSDTHYLILGKPENPENFPGDDQAKIRIKKASQAREQLEKEASDNGVATINLDNFLAFVGYTPPNRIFHPGEAYKLKQGARVTATESDKAAGKTSALFEKNRANTKNESSGQTSGKFK